MGYAAEKKHVESLSLREGERKRTVCPNCGGLTLICSREAGKVSWFCFRASCPTSAAYETVRDLAAIRSALRPPEDKVPVFEVPARFTSVRSSDEAVAYLRRVNALPAYESGLADIRYDPQQRRVVFLIRHMGHCNGAVGRALDRNVLPKWFRYDQAQVPFVCGAGPVGIVVEDAASACAVSAVGVGVALLGTNLSDTHLHALRRFDRVIIALDPDATRKALNLQREISFFVPASVRRIADDLKYYGPEDIRAMLSLN